MCGITGFLGHGGNREQNLQLATRMASRIRHRGPDAEGAWAGEKHGVAFGHARLSIQDLSEHGAQPMTSASGRYVICYNGEVYNFPELMRELVSLGHEFRGHSDTEVMLAAIEQWGLQQAVSRFIGMFAFALWDAEECALHLVRDRLGIKPVYYFESGKLLAFASELKALSEHDSVATTIDREALAAYLRYCYIPAPYSIYEGVRKLPPGAILTARITPGGDIDYLIQPYWSLRDYAGAGNAKFDGSYDDAVAGLHELLGDAVSQRMISDVPLGAFLSGGIDSSTVVALMQRSSTDPVKTFTIGFAEDEYNEAQWARKVATHLQTDHTELYVAPEDALAVIPELASIYDEPFADSSQIPTILVSRLARRDVTVSLSGDGGDELFSGYKRYDLGSWAWRKVGWMPASLRRGTSVLVNGLAGGNAGFLDRAVDPLFRRFGRAGDARDKLRKAAALMRAGTREGVYQHIASHWKDSAAIVEGVDKEPATLLGTPPEWLRELPLFDYMMAADALTYLPDDILVKVDRASMSCSLEARVPILDHRVVEFAFGLPLDFKRRNGHGKSVLRDLLARFIPGELINRPKMGFGVPIDTWLRGPLREWASDLLAADRMRQDGYLDPTPITRKWQEHLSGERNWAYYLWDVLMFQSWLETGR